MKPSKKKKVKAPAADWSKPKTVSAAAMVFGGEMDELLPPMSDIPAGFGDNKWTHIQCLWFFKGLPKETKFICREGIDKAAALRHLGAIQASFSPKHEHKEAAVGWLMSLWFEDVILPE